MISRFLPHFGATDAISGVDTGGMIRKFLALLLMSVFVLVPVGTASAAKLKRGI
jgi:hypothetical protein